MSSPMRPNTGLRFDGEWFTDWTDSVLGQAVRVLHYYNLCPDYSEAWVGVVDAVSIIGPWVPHGCHPEPRATIGEAVVAWLTPFGVVLRPTHACV